MLQFVRSWGSRARSHVSVDGKRTLCGKRVHSDWARISNIHAAKPCSKCLEELPRIKKTGHQLVLF